MKYIICFLIAFGAACVSTKKYHRTAQTIVDFAQATIDSAQTPATNASVVIARADTMLPAVASCRHIWVAVEKDTVVYGLTTSCEMPRKNLICLRCFKQKEQVVAIGQATWLHYPNALVPRTSPKKKP